MNPLEQKQTEPAATPAEPAPRVDVSGREIQVMQLTCEGYTIKEVATELGIAYGTAVAHRNNIIKKLGARNIVHAVTLFFRSGALE